MSTREVRSDTRRLRDELHAVSVTSIRAPDLVDASATRRVRELIRIVASLCANRSLKLCAAELHQPTSPQAQELAREHARLRQLQGELERHLDRLSRTRSSSTERRLAAQVAVEAARQADAHMTHILAYLPNRGEG